MVVDPVAQPPTYVEKGKEIVTMMSNALAVRYVVTLATVMIPYSDHLGAAVSYVNWTANENPLAFKRFQNLMIKIYNFLLLNHCLATRVPFS